jgi:hypothetical protein
MFLLYFRLLELPVEMNEETDGTVSYIFMDIKLTPEM